MFPYISIVLPSYGVLAFIGFFIGLLFLFFRKDKFGIEFDAFIKMSVFGLLGLLIGSKFLFAITQLPWLAEHFSLLNLIMLIPQSGYVFYGGLLGAICGIWLYAINSKRYDAGTAFEFVTPVFPLFHIFGRIGCFFAGCCYGVELQSPMNIHGIGTLERLPTQLIEAFFELILFAVCLTVEKKNLNVALIKLYLISYAVFRFIIEFFRGDIIRGVFIGLSTSQWVSLSILTGLAVLYVRERMSDKKTEVL